MKEPEAIKKSGRGYEYNTFPNGRPPCAICDTSLAVMRLMCGKCYMRDYRRRQNGERVHFWESLLNLLPNKPKEPLK